MSRASRRGSVPIALVTVVLAGAAIAAWVRASQPRSSDPFAAVGASPFASAGTPETPIVFASVGDFGTNNASEAAVANLIDGFAPAFVFTAGDNSYGNAGYDVNVGQYYHEYIGDYSGAFGAGSPTNRFFPSAGNHDWDDGGGIDSYVAFFTLPGTGIASSNTSGNERYYDFVQGPVHFFAISSDPQEPDGETGHEPPLAGEVQAQWLKSALAASTAPWQIVFMHHPPYSSGTGHGSETDLQWPFEAWGADAVIAGHDHTYERILRDDDGDASSCRTS